MKVQDQLRMKLVISLEEQRLDAAKASGGISSTVVYDQIIKIIQDYDLAGSIVDYGGGIGNLTRRLWSMGRFKSVSGSDLLPRPEDLPAAIKWYHVDLNRAVLPTTAFDVVIAAEVIEHLENPREVAREWYRILRPGGTVIMSTPNNESVRSLTALVCRGHYAAFGEESYPAHITALLRKDCSRLLTEAGFSDIRFGFTNTGGIPKMPGLTWQRISGGMLKGCKFSDNVIVTAAK